MNRLRSLQRAGFTTRQAKALEEIGRGTSSASDWVGPYVIRWDDAGLLTEAGRLLFTPTVGTLLLGYILRVVDPFTSPTDEVPRLTFGTWADADENALGFDSDIPVDASTPLWTGTDIMAQVSGSSLHFLGSASEFATDSPVRVSCINGTLDMGDLAKPYPVCDALTAGVAHLWLNLVTPTAP